MIRQSVAVAIASAFCSAAPASAADLTPAEIRSELIGHAIVWWEEGGWLAGQRVLAPDGSAEISVDTPKPAGDIGRWTIRNGEICTQWGEIRDGIEKCYSVQRDAAGRFVTSGGNVFEIREAGV